MNPEETLLPEKEVDSTKMPGVTGCWPKISQGTKRDSIDFCPTRKASAISPSFFWERRENAQSCNKNKKKLKKKKPIHTAVIGTGSKR